MIDDSMIDSTLIYDRYVIILIENIIYNIIIKNTKMYKLYES